MAQVTIKQVVGLKFQVQADTGSHQIVCDQPVSVGGNDGGANPKELVLAGLGACTIQTIMIVAPRRKWDIQDLVVNVGITFPNGASGDPAVTEDIVVTGNLTQAELDDIKRTAEKCPVYKLMFGSKTLIATVTKK
ncbi:MAG: OsmC family protein [Candidatus Melainabacteria bacterium]|nr:OsmC family protein [Candidatus Melainabacteria bacterium]